MLVGPCVIIAYSVSFYFKIKKAKNLKFYFRGSAYSYLTKYTYIPPHTFTYARTYTCMQVGGGEGRACMLGEAKWHLVKYETH